MNCVGAFVAAAPTADPGVCRRPGQAKGAVFKEPGAPAVVDGWREDLPEGKPSSLPLAVEREPHETVAFG
jgi:uncharacterized protein YbaA (DUF1428 family)